MVYRDKAHRLVIRDKSTLTRIILTDSGLASPSKSLYTFFEPSAAMGRQRQSRTEPHCGVSNIAPCKRGRAARSLGYRPHPQQIAAEQQISHTQTCYAVATSLKLTFYPTLHGATHRLHGATSDTVLRTSWLPCSSSLCSAAPYLNHENSLIY